MRQARIEHRLLQVTDRIVATEEELAVLVEQLRVSESRADDARVRSLVSETPLAEREFQEARRHADVMERSRGTLEAELTKLRATRERLLSELD